jgi:hypothetical protein
MVSVSADAGEYYAGRAGASGIGWRGKRGKNEVENGEQRTENREQRTENRKQKTENR